jgi:hypothetical protein
MKMIFLIIALLFFSTSISHGQETDTLSVKENLLKESQRQHKKAVILLSAGAAGAIIGGVLLESNFCIFGCSTGEDVLAGTGGLLFLAGAGCMIASIPAFSKASKNAKKAAELSFNTQPILLPRYSNNGPKSYPALKISFRI